MVDLGQLRQGHNTCRRVGCNRKDQVSASTAFNHARVQRQSDRNAVARQTRGRVGNAERIGPYRRPRTVCAVARTGNRKRTAKVGSRCVGVGYACTDGLRILRGQQHRVGIDHRRINRWRIVLERQRTCNVSGGTGGIAVTIGRGCSERDQVRSRQAGGLVRASVRCMDNRTHLIEGHIAIGSNTRGKHNRTARTGTANNLASLKGQNNRKVGRGIDQTGRTRVDTKRISRSPGTIGTKVGGKHTGKACNRVGPQHGLVNDQSRCRTRRSDRRTIIGKADVAAKVDGFTIVCSIAVAICNTRRRSQRNFGICQNCVLVVKGRCRCSLYGMIYLGKLGQRNDACAACCNGKDQRSSRAAFDDSGVQ